MALKALYGKSRWAKADRNKGCDVTRDVKEVTSGKLRKSVEDAIIEMQSSGEEKMNKYSQFENETVWMKEMIRLRQLGWKPYESKVMDGEQVELISYPWLDDDGKVVILARTKDDPTTMRKFELPKGEV